MCFSRSLTMCFRPEIALAVLHPFEVGNRNAAGVGEDVGDHEHSALKQDVVGGRRGGAVGALHQKFRLHFVGILAGDDAFRGGRQQDIAFLLQDFLRPDAFAAAKALDRSCASRRIPGGAGY